MTSVPEPPGHLLTIADYAALGEDDRYRWELQEGNLVMSPSPTPRHMIASGELRDQLKRQLPTHSCVILRGVSGGRDRLDRFAAHGSRHQAG